MVTIRNRYTGEIILEIETLQDADLQDADLRNADLRNADLWNANLRNADLRNADLRNANLRNADLRNANLLGANLRNANLLGANLRNADLPHFQICPEEGAFIAFKKVGSSIVKLLIPSTARRNSCLTGRKCRAEFVEVLEVCGKDQTPISGHDCQTMYTKGKTVYPDKYNDDIGVCCTNGIHFFVTKKEAEEW